MGVSGTFCQVCGLPVQHDHYVRTDGGYRYAIYRGDPARWDAVDPHFPFTADHAWLTRAVAISYADGTLARGEVSDGLLVDPASGARLHVFAGDDDGRTYHAACWEALGSPLGLDDAPRCAGAHRWATLAAYHQQLFALLDFAADGRAWMLADPTGTSPDAARSRRRIEACIADARRVEPMRSAPEPATLDEVVRLDRGWSAQMFHSDDPPQREIIHYRTDIVPGLDVRGFETMVCLIREYAGDAAKQPSPELRAELEELARLVKATVEDGSAVLVASTFGGALPQAQFYVYARDAAHTRALLDGIPGHPVPKPDDYAIESDPGWDIYFNEVYPAR